MKILINYADEKYITTQKLNTWTGKHIAKFDKIYSFGPQDIDIEYYEAHRAILEHPRGNGLWLWKPYFIDRVLNECNDGDYIFYVDSGAFFLKNIDVLIQSFYTNDLIWVSDNPTLENCFTKEICFSALDCDKKEIRFSNQIQGGYLGVIRCEETRRFVKEWLNYCERPELILPETSLRLDKCIGTEFVAHREDQSLLSLMCKKKGIKVHRDPSQRGFFPETFYNEKYAYVVPKHDDVYGTVVFLHKSPKVNLWDIFKMVIRTMVAKIRYGKIKTANI